ncbi:uncharacterized protein C8A04DRAFT_14310 [Dichotomopilus funicola]|uniref:AB hydrolase-1 domain-containing protein n=1 Tax=Dichotomopilus funicola TaxID=1934379 RepID=A0AAN6UXU9_9PEZI|nr:hypothetical protein C8A04DRAFT_14310 [Dichotomopilus funicola]
MTTETQTQTETLPLDINDPRFHRTFTYTLPPSSDHSNTLPSLYKLTYADFGYRNETHPDQERVVLFSPPLMGSRLLFATKDALAKRHRIRVISVDRPGFGGSEQVPAAGRLALWRETIPALLTHLSIPHLHAILSHSAGTLYALDLLHHLFPANPPTNPHQGINTILSPDPSNPTLLALGAPWILPAHTGAMAPALLKMLPAGLVSRADAVGRMANSAAAGVGVSAGVVGRLGGLVAGNGDGERETQKEDAKEEDRVWPSVMKQIYTEGVPGLSEDALLVLHKGAGMDSAAGWGGWGDYDTLVPALVEGLRRAGRRLRVEVRYAETDVLTGNGGVEGKGAKWFDGCWRDSVGRDGDDQVVVFGSRTVEGADHDGVWGLRWGAVQEVFGIVGGV